MNTTITTYFSTEIGTLEIKGNEDHIESVLFVEEQRSGQNVLDSKDSELPREVSRCVNQLNEYFQGSRTKFDLTFNTGGTAFQERVWKELRTIRYAETVSYKEMAESIKNPKAVRAVGGANGRNPISIIIPCHRVIANDGSLGGYGGGIWRKEWLLEHEKKVLSK